MVCRTCHITNFDELSLQLALNNDAFARLRVSEPYTIFDSKQVVDTTLFFDDQEVSGGGTSSTFSSDRASTIIGVSNAVAGKRVRQTYQRFNYQPGKSQLFIETFVMGDTEAGVTKEVGLFDDDNGLFLRNDGGAISIVVRSFVTGSAVDVVIPQASWNQDVMDGAGESGVTLDFTKAQIFFADFEWLGVGTVRFGFFIDGQPIYVHYQNHANSISSVYMSNPNLPLRYSIDGDGTQTSDDDFEHICSTVVSEGSLELTGIVRSIDRGIAPLTTLSNTNIYPLISMRLKDIARMISVSTNAIQVFTSSNVDFRWTLLLNPTVAGVDAVSWINLADSAIEYDVSRDNTNVLSGGTQLASGYGSSSNQAKSPVERNIVNAIRLGQNIAGDREELVLGVQNLVSGTNAYLAEIDIRELL
jgi:hypothetical protein